MLNGNKLEHFSSLGKSLLLFCSTIFRFAGDIWDKSTLIGRTDKMLTLILIPNTFCQAVFYSYEIAHLKMFSPLCSDLFHYNTKKSDRSERKLKGEIIDN